MKAKERKEQESRLEDVLRGIFGTSFKEADFCYHRGRKGLLVTYEDFKPESELNAVVQQAVGSEWRVVLKREFSDVSVMLALLKLYKENRVAVVDEVGGELRPFQIRHYVNWLLTRE